MGQADVENSVTPDQLREFSRRVLNDLAALTVMLEKGVIESGVRRIGAEQEMFLVDRNGQPASVGPAVLKRVDDEHLTTELGRFNLELNLDPQRFEGACFAKMETELEDLLAKVRDGARAEGAEVLLTGILPTLRVSHLDLAHMTPLARYSALNEAMSRMRGGRPYDLHIRGRDEIRLMHDNVMFEACNTSFQVHLQVDPGDFARLYNVAQVVTAPVLAVAANSPLLLGRQLWCETRIALFEQSIDTRPRTGHPRDSPRRVSFGRRWIDDSVVEIFEEDISRFSAILAQDIDEDPFRMLERGDAPRLRALALHNGTIYRWNRPCYGICDGRPHLRIENRVIPSGPTVVDEMANAAFWLGLMVGVSTVIPDVRTAFAFSTARENFVAAARHGMGAYLKWTGGQRLPAGELITKELVPIAREGLAAMKVAAADSERLLGVIEERAATGRGGADWLISSFEELRGVSSQSVALESLTQAALSRQIEGLPIHAWKPVALDEIAGTPRVPKRVEELMSTDLFTVHEEEIVDIVASVMKWRHIRRVPVEDGNGRLVGLVTYRALLKVLGGGTPTDRPLSVREIMTRDLVTVSPSTTNLEAARLMRQRGIGCLPVVDGRDHLVGILTEHDFIELAWPELESALEQAASEERSQEIV